MKDDFTTLTNAYPDHEDIQGPTGLDVAQTISQFIPFKGHVVTTEQHMIPILRQKAWERASILREQSVLDWRLLGRDVLDLLPYNDANLKRIQKEIKGYSSEFLGGTEIYAPLKELFDLKQKQGFEAQVWNVFLLTDGDVSSPDKVISLIKEKCD